MEVNLILSIESSCDDSSLALSRISDYKLLFHMKISQEREHKKYGGVVPELASRLHAIALPRVLEALKNKIHDLNLDLNLIKAIAVTNEPGLSVSLIEGVMMAKALSLALKKPLIAINHLEGHIYSLFLESKMEYPLSILLLSGGHSMILEVDKKVEKINLIANTLDDSFGEAFDKVAKMLDLGYPGGSVVEALALEAIEKSISFPIPLKNYSKIAFSFSGLKNAVRLEIQKFSSITREQKSEICFAFQKSAIDHVSLQVKKYLSKSRIINFGVVGGCSANKVLRNALEEIAFSFNKKILFAPFEFCSDNAAMIGRCAIDSYNKRNFVELEKLDISPSSTIFKN